MAIVRGTIVSGDADRVFTGVSIDTRTVRPGELYIGIRGERFDGADFAQAAIAEGAGGLVVPRGRGRGLTTIGAQATVLEVDDTTAALQALSRAVRIESGTRVVAITGSAGKTTTKEVAADFLAAKYRVIRNRGNFNNHIGLPLSLMELTARPDVAVVELGMNHAGEISTLVRIAEPDVRVWTNVGEAHMGFFASVDAIADAKAEIFEGANGATTLIANADDDRIAARTPLFGGRLVTFGIEHDADVRATAIVDRGIDGTTAQVTTPAGSITVATPLVGRGNLANILAAAAVAVDFGVPLGAIAERAARLRPASHRGEVVRLPNGVTVIDDSYNANPTATRKSLEMLRDVTGAGRRIAVLGEMLELGDHAVVLHEDVGRAAAGSKLDLLLTVGGAAATVMANAAVAHGMPRECVHQFETSGAAAAAAAGWIRRGDVVLVKGSRGIRTDIVVERLQAECA